MPMLPRRAMNLPPAPDQNPTGAMSGGGGPDTSALSDADLAALAQQAQEQGTLGGAGVDMGADQTTVPELQQALDDPNLDPASRQNLQAQLAMAARRRIAGVGGP